jgi:hypothetical protein
LISTPASAPSAFSRTTSTSAPAFVVGSPDGFRVTAANQPGGEIFFRGNRFRFGDAAVEQARQGHHSSRTGEQKAPGFSVLVHRQLDGREQGRGFLDSINHHGPAEIAEEPGSIPDSQSKSGGIIQGDIPESGPSGHLLDQHGFARLPWAAKQHDTGYRPWPAGRNSGYFASSW